MWRLDQKSAAKKTTKSAAAKTTSRLGVRQKTVAKKPAAIVQARLGLGRIAVSEGEAPNLFANLVWSG
jgi:hypothetical protein